jgi:hypothetical protein
VPIRARYSGSAAHPRPIVAILGVEHAQRDVLASAPRPHARSQRVGTPSRDGPRDGYSYRERFSKRQQHYAGLQRLARAAQPRQHSARLQSLSRGRMYGHRRHHLIFLTRLFLFISGLPACERNLQPSHPDSDGIHQCSAAADSGAVYRPRDGSFARCVAM